MDTAGRTKRTARGIWLLAVILALAVAIVVGLPNGSQASAAPVTVQTGTAGQSVTAFEDTTIRADQVYENVVIFGGDVTVEGTVLHSVVAVAGDVTLAPTARVGTEMTRDDLAVICLGGHVTTQPGAVVTGKAGNFIHAMGELGRAAGDAVAEPFLWPWDQSWDGWLASLLGMVAVALIIAAVAPRQVLVVRDRVRHHFWSSFGWGVLGAVIIIPIVSVLLAITLIGILLLVPGLTAGVPLLFLFGFTAVGAWLGSLILSGRSQDRGEVDRGRVMTAAVIGVALLSLLVWLPFVGAVVLGVLWLTGLGAVMSSLGVWRRGRRQARRTGRAGMVPGEQFQPSLPGSYAGPGN